MIHSNGDVYSGQWKKNKKHGIGEFIYANGDVYRGVWNNGNKKN